MLPFGSDTFFKNENRREELDDLWARAKELAFILISIVHAVQLIRH